MSHKVMSEAFQSLSTNNAIPHLPSSVAQQLLPIVAQVFFSDKKNVGIDSVHINSNNHSPDVPLGVNRCLNPPSNSKHGGYFQLECATPAFPDF
jgi:hypothetical protein